MKEPNSNYGWWCNYYIKNSAEVKISVMKTLQSLGDHFYFSKSWEVFCYCFNLLFHFTWFCFTSLIDYNDTNRVSVESFHSESLKCASEWMVSFDFIKWHRWLMPQNQVNALIASFLCKMRCVEKGVLQQYCPWEGKGMGFPINFGEVYAMRCLNPDSIQGWIKRK